MKQYFDIYGNETNNEKIHEIELKHFTRDVINRSFEKEKVLRSLTGKEREKFQSDYRKEIISQYIPIFRDNSLFYENGKWGLKNNVFDIVIIHPEYDEISSMDAVVLYEDIPKSYNCCKVKLDNKYGIIIPTVNGGKVICPLICDEIILAEDYSDTFADVFAFIIKVNGKCGLTFGNKIDIPPIYDRIIHVENHDFIFLVEKDGKYGLYNNLLVPAEYDEIKIPVFIGWIKARKGDVWGYFDNEGKFTEDISRAYMISENGCYNFLGKGKNVISHLLNDLSDYMNNFLEFTKEENIIYIGEDKEDNYIEDSYNLPLRYYIQSNTGIGLRNMITGVDLIPAIYEELWRIPTLKIYCYKRNGKWGFVDDKGLELSPPIYDEIQEINDYIIVREEKKWGIVGYINSTMDYNTEIVYDELIPLERSSENGFILKNNNKIGAVVEGYIIPSIYDGVFIPEVLGWIRVCKQGEWGYLDKNNEFTMDVSRAYMYYSCW